MVPSGLGTALKPSYEPIILARKPLVGTVAENVLKHGTGALNIDGSRIGFASDADECESKDKNRHGDFGSGPRENKIFGQDQRARSAHGNYDSPGRWPANVVLDQEAARLLDEQSGTLTSGTGAVKRATGAGWQANAYGKESRAAGTPNLEYGDTGGASRFFYTSKAGREDRDGSKHPTVKPLDLMAYLVRLIAPPGGLVLDPFAGSGTTIWAAREHGFRAIGIEKDRASLDDAVRRLRQTVLPL